MVNRMTTSTEVTKSFTILIQNNFIFITARIRRMGKVMFSLCPSTPGGGGTQSPFRNTSTGPMSFQRGTLLTGFRSLLGDYPSSRWGGRYTSSMWGGTPVPGGEVSLSWGGIPVPGGEVPLSWGTFPNQDRTGVLPPRSPARTRR